MEQFFFYSIIAMLLIFMVLMKAQKDGGGKIESSHSKMVAFTEQVVVPQKCLDVAFIQYLQYQPISVCLLYHNKTIT
jgi:hypothetical protein